MFINLLSGTECQYLFRSIMRTVDLKKGHLSRLTPLQAVSPATLAFFPLLLPQGLCTGWYHCLRWLTLHPLSHKTNSFFRFQFKSHFLSKAFPDTLDRVYFSVLYSLGDSAFTALVTVFMFVCFTVICWR